MTSDAFFESVSRETLDRLDIYERLLRKWNPKINLVSANTLNDLWRRHFLDSAQLVSLGADFRSWTDLGSGGGFPGMVCAILVAEKAKVDFILIESDQRKAAFLSAVARETGIPTKIVAERAEAVSPQNASIVSARALAPLPRLLPMVERHLAHDGMALLLKGRGADEEVEEALENFRFDVQKIPSQTDPNGVILKIEGLSRV